MKSINKKGVVGFEVVEAVVFSLLVIAVLGFVVIVIMNSLESPAATIEGKTAAANIINESFTAVNEIPQNLVKYSLTGVACTITQCVNTTGTVGVIPTSNYTSTGTGCNVAAVPITVFNNTNWKCSYSYTYNKGLSASITGNVSSGTAGFFSNVSTFYSILVIVVIIALIALIILYITRFRGEGRVAA